MSAMGRGLGRGLASLIPDSALEVDALPPGRSTLRQVPISEVRPNPEQPRVVFDRAALDELASSIKIHGVLTPLVARRHEGRYILVAGERRLRAAALAGLQEVPVVVREAAEPATQLELALVENLQRSDLDPIEAAQGFKRLVEVHGYTAGEVATSVGKQRTTVANAMRLLNLPDFVLDTVRSGRISAGHGRALLPLVADPDELRGTLARVIAQQLSVRATERIVARLVKLSAVHADDRRDRARTLDYATKLLTDALRTEVRISRRKKGGGRIEIHYASGEELERLIGVLRGEATEP
jgi:ParB family transcriptional regulator, chromosome partitioning protein